MGPEPSLGPTLRPFIDFATGCSGASKLIRPQYRSGGDMSQSKGRTAYVPGVVLGRRGSDGRDTDSLARIGICDREGFCYTQLDCVQEATMPKANDMITDVLEESGITDVFGIPGGGTGQIYNSL